MPDERWNELFAAMRSNRDRAILALAVSTAARASELLGLRGADLDWGDQLAQVRRKGSGAQQWLPASAESFVWLRLYLEDLGPLGPDAPVWWTLRRRERSGDVLERRPLTYDALRAVLRRANTALGTNWTMHDLRHTSALRMVRSQRLSLRDVQVVLGHAHLTTTQIYLVEDDQEILRRVHQYLADQAEPSQEAVASESTVGYDSNDLAVLLGGVPR
ncbi:site-specific integrase [Streptomyces sp. NPDC091215]|uniref:tyrosine-type recombinase/integrase n=2 Tax=unclassified Streptomyces TaxID=2593676 RepID=UPI00341A4804